jgi:hypothetical protein
MPGEPSWDTGTCATTAFTDKGRFSTSSKMTGYPPRADVARTTADSLSVDMFKMMNPFDAVSQATPAAGTLAHAAWPVPTDLPVGHVFVETAKETTHDTYNTTTLGSPPIFHGASTASPIAANRRSWSHPLRPHDQTTALTDTYAGTATRPVATA